MKKNDCEIKRAMTAEEVIDEQLILAHLGTLESYDCPYSAVADLLDWHQSIGAYFALTESVFGESK